MLFLVGDCDLQCFNCCLKLGHIKRNIPLQPGEDGWAWLKSENTPGWIDQLGQEQSIVTNMRTHVITRHAGFGQPLHCAYGLRFVSPEKEFSLPQEIKFKTKPP
jgi:hypothetical protein